MQRERESAKAGPLVQGKEGWESCMFFYVESRVCVSLWPLTLEWVGKEGWARCPCHPTAPLCPPLQPTKP